MQNAQTENSADGGQPLLDRGVREQGRDGIWRDNGKYITQWRVDDATRGCGATRYCVRLVGPGGELLDQIFNSFPPGGVRTFLKRERAQAEADRRNVKLFSNTISQTKE